jgi:hypothetical protein
VSAAPVPSPSDPIRAICRTPASYFHSLLELLNYSEILCFGLILDSTVGYGQATEWAEISDEQFHSATNESKEWVLIGIARLEKFGLIRCRKNQVSGRREYALSDQLRGEADVKGRKFKGRCPQCKTIGTFATEYIAVPHPFFRKLGGCLDHASYVCLAVIVRYSLKWTGEKGVWTEWAELDLNDFERLTGLDKRAISQALAKLVDINGWRLIERFNRAGKASAYRAIPERFGKIERRGPRLVEQPAKTEKTPPTKGDTKNPNKTAETHEFESVHKNFGFCLKCRHFVTPEEVSEEELQALEVERPPRSGPTRETKPKSKFWDDMERRRKEAIETAERGIA